MHFPREKKAPNAFNVIEITAPITRRAGEANDSAQPATCPTTAASCQRIATRNEKRKVLEERGIRERSKMPGSENKLKLG